MSAEVKRGSRAGFARFARARLKNGPRPCQRDEAAPAAGQAQLVMQDGVNCSLRLRDGGKGGGFRRAVLVDTGQVFTSDLRNQGRAQ